MSDTHEPDLTDADVAASPGEQLRRERESQGLSVSEVAGALNLRPAVIRGLEDDSYDEVPIATYRRGYLRAYAHLLGIDDRPVLDAYRTRFGHEDAAQRKVTPVHVTKPPSRLGAWLFRLVTLLVIAGLVGLTLLWWQSRGGNEPPRIGNSDPVSVDSLDGSTTVTESDATAPAEPESLPPLPEEAADATPSEDLAMADTPADGAAPPAESEPADAPDGAEVPDVAAAEAAAPSEADEAREGAAEDESEAPAADPRQLELTFNEQSWTEIFDADNQRIFVGLQEPGTTASVEGEPPFRLTVGNATGVELVWQGESVDLGARAGANNVARFTLGE